MKCLAPLALACVAYADPTLAEHKTGQEASAAAAAAAKKNEAKMAAVNKVIDLFENLRAEVLAEGEKEAASYETFACFCKDMTAEKQAAIQTGQDDKTSLTTKITELHGKRDDLDGDIAEMVSDIATAEEAMKTTTKERKETNKVYTGDATDLSGAIEAVALAIQAIKSSKSASLAQIQSVRNALVLADALGVGDASAQRAASMFLQDDEVPGVSMENYKFHGGGVITMLETLQDNFRKKKTAVDKVEVQSVYVYDTFMQEKTDLVKKKTREMDRLHETKSETIAAIQMNSKRLTTTSSVLLDDKHYMAELAQMCSDKAKTWDQRTGLRSDELSALTAAITIIKSSVTTKTSAASVRLAQQGVRVGLAVEMAHNELALEAAESEAEEADSKNNGAKAVSFLQRIVKHGKPSAESLEVGRQAVINMLDKAGKKMKSSLLMSLANQISNVEVADPFGKIKKLIGELIERLLAEAASESEQKGFCDKAQAAAKGKRARSAEKIKTLNGRLATNEAVRDKLKEEIKTIRDEYAELTKNRAEAITLRNISKIQNNATVTEAEEGLAAVNDAIDIMDKFYKTAAKAEVDLSLVQRGPLDDMPDAGFDNGEAYTGAQGGSTGVLGLLDVIKSDFERTISVTQKQELQAQEDHDIFLTETGKSLAEKNMGVEEKTREKDDTIDEIEADNDSLTTEVTMLQNVIRELLDLKPACVDTGMSYEERVARREDEIESLKKALCIFNNYADYGPDSAGQC